MEKCLFGMRSKAVQPLPVIYKRADSKDKGMPAFIRQVPEKRRNNACVRGAA